MSRARARTARRGLCRATLLAPAVAALAATASGPASAAAQRSTPVEPPASTPPAGTAAVGAAQPAGTVVLSDRRTVSHWAYPASEAPVRSAPSPQAHRVGRLRLLTSDAQAELYLALASRRGANGATWIRVEIPSRPNGLSGWVPASALGPLHTVDGYLHIDRLRLRATLYRGGRVILSAPVGVGKPGTITPAGRFYVMEKLRTIGAPVYGPYAIGTSAYAPSLSEWPGGGVVGIHGTNEPQLIPGRPSHGCIRMRNADVSRLWHLISVGTPIEIT
jgi:lipoprotein-anchoring transpeptidase ErfK/SrfK